MYSKKFAPYYDLLMGDYSSLIHKTEQLLNRYVQKNTAVSSVCGMFFYFVEQNDSESVVTLVDKSPPSTFYFGRVQLEPEILVSHFIQHAMVGTI